MTIVSVLLPTKGRPEQAARCVARLLSQESPPGVHLTVVCGIFENDRETALLLEPLAMEDHRVTILYRIAGSTAVMGWNGCYTHAKYGDLADWFVLGADDAVFEDGWLAAALAVAGRYQVQVVGLNDGHTDIDVYAPHYMASRRFCEGQLGGNIAPPCYYAWWFDREVCERAQQRGEYGAAWDARATHNHPDWGTAEMDATYEEAWPLHDRDKRTYERRRKVNYAEVVR